MPHTLRLEHLDHDGKVVATYTVPKTDEGVKDLATVLLASIPGGDAADAYSEAGRVRRGELPPGLLEAMKRPRGELREIDSKCQNCGLARGFHGRVLAEAGDPQCGGFV